jgi:hypothetical protein
MDENDGATDKCGWCGRQCPPADRDVRFGLVPGDTGFVAGRCVEHLRFGRVTTTSSGPRLLRPEAKCGTWRPRNMRWSGLLSVRVCPCVSDSVRLDCQAVGQVHLAGGLRERCQPRRAAPHGGCNDEHCPSIVLA